ncbi:MAG: ZIP family metal transporter [Bacilli bacterium]|nr:ZIP family metal transporter [Bacilli bacterium]
MLPLLLTFISGLFFLVGIIIYKITKNKERLNLIAIASASVIILGLIFFDLLPEIIEIGNWWLSLFIMLGLALLMILDFFIPHHTHHHKEHHDNKKEHQGHINHIGVMTIAALLLHNLVEGMALYSVTLSSSKSGVLMCLGIGLHNLPFGLQIASYTENKKNIALIILLILSGLIGGIIVNFWGVINELILGIIIAITLGMILHILLFELLKEVIHNVKKKETIYGIIVGIIILILIRLI